jgi:PHD/YefM family antitoxin component YafN of YafNO toxin-antitoxin module
MRTITVSEFRKNIKNYAVLANTEKVIVNRGDGKAFAIVPVEALEDKGYDPEFVKKIVEARGSYAKGEYITVENPDNIWESILSE